MSKVTITGARRRLSALVDEAHRAQEPVYLTHRDPTVAATVDAASCASSCGP